MTTNVTPDIRVRAPKRDDMQAIVDLAVACDIHDLGQPDFSVGVLDEDWANPRFSPENDAWLLEQNGQLLAYGALFPSHNGLELNTRGHGWVHPDHRGRGVGHRLLTLQEERACERLPEAEDGPRVVFQAWGQGRAPVQRLFARHGLTHVRSNWRMLIEMTEAPPAPQWPAGIEVRSWTEDTDRAVHAANEEAFADHWGHSPDPYEEWQRGREHMTDFDPELWLLATDGDQIAGVCLCTYFLGEGYVQDLSVRRPWRKHGLGLALLHEAFGRFWRRGTAKVGLGVDSQNLSGATRLYERAGMHVQFQFDRYEKELRAGREIRNMG